MKAVDFPQRNVMLAEHQEEYETLPVFLEMNEVTVVVPNMDPEIKTLTKRVPWAMTACFELSAEELEEVNRTGRIWYQQMLFGANFHPIMMSTLNPFKHEASNRIG